MRYSALLLAATVGIAPAAARANSALWFDPDLGCGRAEVFAATSKLADLPGCTGRLPKSAPEVERVLHDAKRSLLDVEQRIVHGDAEPAAPLLDAIARSLAHTPPPHPELPDRWEQARPIYERTVENLRSRARLLPRIARLRSAYQAAMTAGQAVTAQERDGGPRLALTAADACIAEFAEARAAGVDLSVEAELHQGRSGTLAAGLEECRALHVRMESLARAEELACQAKRNEWRKKLKGDRLKIFDAHPDALPDCERAALGWKAAARAPEWRYRTARGVERVTFKGDKVVIDQRP